MTGNPSIRHRARISPAPVAQVLVCRRIGNTPKYMAVSCDLCGRCALSFRLAHNYRPMGLIEDWYLSPQAVFLFSFETGHLRRVKGRSQIRALAGAVSSGPSRQPDSRYRIARSGRQQRSGVIPLDRLPRRCPVCETATIVGHGRRLRQAHESRHSQVWIRRGLCRQCNKTFTILPDWLVPFGHYGLRCR